MRVRLEAELGHRASAFDHASKARSREWRAALRREYERQLGILLTQAKSGDGKTDCVIV
jgi:hypothetical protein